VIGGGLALNDTGFILVQAMCPTFSRGRSTTLFLSLGGRSLQWGYKQEGERWGVQEVWSAPTRRAKSYRNFAVSLRSEPGGSTVVSYWTYESKGAKLGSVGLFQSILPLLEGARPLLQMKGTALHLKGRGYGCF